MKPEKRKIFIGGNWKMNLLTSQVSGYAETLKKHIADDGRLDICLCVPYLCLERAAGAFENTGVSVAAQNVNENESGAYTGEVSCAQLRDIGVTRAVIGHSERRLYNGETDKTVNAKLLYMLSQGFEPIVCVGESDEVRTAGNAESFVKAQLIAAFENVPCDALPKIVVAYEPIWAIGTGKAATAEISQEMCAFIRSVLREKYGDTAENVSIAYGGSVTKDNIAELLKMPDIDGALIGGASLSPDHFGEIIRRTAEIL